METQYPREKIKFCDTCQLINRIFAFNKGESPHVRSFTFPHAILFQPGRSGLAVHSEAMSMSIYDKNNEVVEM